MEFGYGSFRRFFCFKEVEFLVGGNEGLSVFIFVFLGGFIL